MKNFIEIEVLDTGLMVLHVDSIEHFYEIKHPEAKHKSYLVTKRGKAFWVMDQYETIKQKIDRSQISEELYGIR
jgi:hypothetical protein